jgi:hypothetical protein
VYLEQNPFERLYGRPRSKSVPVRLRLLHGNALHCTSHFSLSRAVSELLTVRVRVRAEFGGRTQSRRLCFLVLFPAAITVTVLRSTHPPPLLLV